MSSVDEPVCGDTSVVTASEFDVCVCGSLVSDETVDVVSVVACGDDPLLPDAVRIGGCLSVIGDTLVCDSGIARSGRGDTDVMVVPGVAQPVWVDELAHLRRRFLAARATPGERIVVASWTPVLLTAAC